jgi:hypothetical protein
VAPVLKIKGDRMMEEIMISDVPVIVDDARLDPCPTRAAGADGFAAGAGAAPAPDAAATRKNRQRPTDLEDWPISTSTWIGRARAGRVARCQAGP